MSRFRSIRNSFLGGQISPTAQARTDLPTYVHSCALLQNVIPLISGGVYRRPGTFNVDSLPITTNFAPRLIPFVPTLGSTGGTGIPYCLLLGKTVGGSNYAQVYLSTANNGDAFGPTSVSGTPPYTFKTLANYSVPNSNNVDNQDDEIHQVQFCQSVNVMYLTHPNHKPQYLTQTGFGNFVWSNFDDVTQAAFAGSATNQNGFNLASQYPFLDENTNTAITLAAGTGYGTAGTSITLTSNTANFFQKTGGINGTGHVGSIFRIYASGGSGLLAGGGAAIVTAVATGGLTATATVLIPFQGTTATSQWFESAWSNFRGWPKSICIYTNRVVMAGTYNQPDTLWFSDNAGYQIFSHPNTSYPSSSAGSGGDGSTTGPSDSQAFYGTLQQQQLDAIQWLSPDKQLLVGTTGAEWLLYGTAVQLSSGATDLAFSANSVVTQVQSHYGSDNVPAVRIGYELIFPLRSKAELRAYQYNYFDQSFFAEPIQLSFDEYPIAETNSLLGGGRRKIRFFDWDSTRNTLWCIDTAGNFFGMTRDRKLQLTAWHTHQMGGFNSAQGVQSISVAGSPTIDPAYGACDGSVLSLAVIPNPSIGINDIWMVVKRTLAGVVNFQVERMIGANTVRNSAYTSIFPGYFNEPYLLDSCSFNLDNGDPTNFTYPLGNNVATNKNLDGYTPTAIYYSPTYGIFNLPCSQVGAGETTIISSPPADYGTATNVVVIGLPFAPVIQPVRIEAGSQIGTAQGAIKAFGRVITRLYKTMSLQVGQPPSSEDTMAGEDINFFNPLAPMGQSPEVFTGDKIVFPPSTYETDGYIYLTQSLSLPLTVVGVIYEGVEFDES